MSEMKSIWAGRVDEEKRRRDGDEDDKKGTEGWRAHLIYVACVRDNRKVKGIQLRAGGR